MTACERRLEGLRGVAGDGLRYRVEVPFVIAGDVSAAELERIARGTVCRAAEALWAGYFDRRPTEPITVLLLADATSYTRYAERLFGDTDLPHFGYYRRRERTLVMNIATGTGTLVHELVHALGDYDFRGRPDWFDEGLASLYEQCTLADGRIRGMVNWRLPALQKALAAGTLRPLSELITADDFRGSREGLNYAHARYFCLYLESQGWLQAYYRRFRDGFADDPTGLRFLPEVCNGQSVQDIDRAYRRWLATLAWR